MVAVNMQQGIYLHLYVSEHVNKTGLACSLFDPFPTQIIRRTVLISELDSMNLSGRRSVLIVDRHASTNTVSNAYHA